MTRPPLTLKTLDRYRYDARKMRDQLRNSGHAAEAEAADALYKLLSAVVDQLEAKAKD